MEAGALKKNKMVQKSISKTPEDTSKNREARTISPETGLLWQKHHATIYITIPYFRHEFERLVIYASSMLLQIKDVKDILTNWMLRVDYDEKKSFCA